MVQESRDHPPSPELITFDLDGTLLDDTGWHSTVIRTCERVARDFGLDAHRLAVANTAAWSEFWPGVEEQWTLGARDGASITLEAWTRTLLRAGYDPAFASEVASAYLEERAAALRLFPDVEQSLVALRGRARLGLITNGASDTQRFALRTLGIEDLFDVCVISADVRVAKPDPRIFQIAIAETHSRPEATWHVGDGLESDVAGAHSAGTTAVWLNRAEVHRAAADPQPDAVITDLRELVVLLNRISHG